MAVIEPLFIPQPIALRRTEQAYSLNDRRLLTLIRDKGPISRADLARETGLALQSVVRLVAHLMERGLVQGGEKVASGPGQPSLPISLAPDAAFSLGVSIMDDALSAVLVDLTGRIRTVAAELFDTTSRDRVASRLAEMLSDMTAKAGIDPARLVGVGVALPGFFVDGGDRINAPVAMEEWALTDIAQPLGSSLDLPVWIENDGGAAAAGESLYGVGRRHRTFAYLYIGSGLGGGLVMDGRPWRGWRGNSGEFTGLLPPVMREKRPTLALLLQMLKRRGLDLHGVGDLVRRFDPAWPEIETWLQETRDATTAILSSAAAVLDPEAIVIGGRIPVDLARRLAAEAGFFTVPVRGRDRRFPLVLPQETEGDAAAIGAAALPFLHRYF